MKLSLKLLLSASAVALLMSGCAQKVKIKALNPAEVGEMATKKKVAVSKFKKDTNGLSGKIEAKIASHKLDKKKYFTVVSRKDLDKIIAEQKLQSSELMDEATATKVGKLIGAQAVVNGEISSATVEKDKYTVKRQKCVRYVKNQGCAQYRYYNETCNTMKASVSANINIVDVENGSMIYGDTITKEYNTDTCKLFSNKILSKGQVLNKLTSDIASEFVHKLTPHYVYFDVTLLEEIELENTTDKQKETLKVSLEYIKAGRMDKAEKLLQGLLDSVKGESYVVAYDFGVVNEAQGKFEKAKKMYAMADELTLKPVEEINAAILRIDNLISKTAEAKQQINAN